MLKFTSRVFRMNKFDMILIAIFLCLFSSTIFADSQFERKQKLLDKKCDIAREKKLKPERERLIKTCVKTGLKNLKNCTYYYSTYGNASNDGFSTTPRLYGELPECVKAFKHEMDQ